MMAFKMITTPFNFLVTLPWKYSTLFPGAKRRIIVRQMGCFICHYDFLFELRLQRKDTFRGETISCAFRSTSDNLQCNVTSYTSNRYSWKLFFKRWQFKIEKISRLMKTNLFYYEWWKDSFAKSCALNILNKIKYGIYEVDKLFYKIFFSISLFVSTSKL